MTQAPIHPRHKDEAAKAAGYDNWIAAKSNFSVGSLIKQSILAHAQTLANLEAARADLAEIDRIVVVEGWNMLPDKPGGRIAAIAAPYRASDPVAEAAREAIEAIWQHGTPSRDAVIAAVINLARTIEGER